MTKFRVIVDLKCGVVSPSAVDTIEFEPGKLYYRKDGSTWKEITSEPAFFGENFMVSGWHDCESTARQEVADLLAARGEQLETLRLRCLYGREEVASV